MTKTNQVHLVPTDKPSNIQLNKGAYTTGKTFLTSSKALLKPKEEFYKNQHLYLTDDSVIKGGDWALDIVFNKVYQFKEIKENINGYKKITVTTNPELHQYIDLCKAQRMNLTGIVGKIPNSFIDFYIKSPVKEIELEYEYKCENGHVMSKATGCVYPHCHSVTELQLKLTPQGEVICSTKEQKMDWNGIERILQNVRLHECSVGTATAAIIAEYERIHKQK